MFNSVKKKTLYDNIIFILGNDRNCQVHVRDDALVDVFGRTNSRSDGERKDCILILRLYMLYMTYTLYRLNNTLMLCLKRLSFFFR